MLRRVVLVTVLAALASGCATVTGRPFAEWTDDKALVASVKAAIVGVSWRNLTRINVDVHDHVVYLSGTVRDAETKARTEEAARAVAGVRQVVSHLVAAQTDAVAALPAAAVARPVPSALAGVARFEGAHAYDVAGVVVATVYIVAMTELAHSPSDQFMADRPVHHVTVHAMQPDAYTPVPHYLFVLWHVPQVTSPR